MPNYADIILFDTYAMQLLTEFLRIVNTALDCGDRFFLLSKSATMQIKIVVFSNFSNQSKISKRQGCKVQVAFEALVFK